MLNSSGTSLSPISSNSSSEKPTLRRKRSSFSDIFKILVVGAESVGKSALVVRFMTKKFIGEYGQTVDCKYRHSEILGNDQILVEIADTCCRASGERLTGADNIKWADGFVIVYSITDRPSFAYLEEVMSRLVECRKMSQMPIMIVANKADMSHRRAVSIEEGEQFARERNCLFSELSVSDDSKAVRMAFLELCKEITLTKRRSRSFLDKVFLNIGGSYKK